MNCFVTGASGFIGSILVDRLLKDGHNVIGYDNFITGNINFLENAFKYSTFNLIKGDISDTKTLFSVTRNQDIIFHLAARADVRYNETEYDYVYKNNILGTYNIIKSCINNNIEKIVFPSTGSVYGDGKLFPTPESAPMSNQTSIYAASKITGENLIQSFCNTFDLKGYIFRFVSVLGQRYTHGHIFDFFNQLKVHPYYLKVLGNGNQRKSYIHVDDLINGIMVGLTANNKINTFNIGTDETSTVKENISWILEELKLNPKIEYGQEIAGWKGDNTFIALNCNRLQSLGWKPEKTIKQSVIDTTRYLKEYNYEL
jgi:UDP-glucose 4-epimerase